MSLSEKVNGDGESFAFTEDEKYLFDTFGFLVVRNVLTSDEVKRANAAIDAHFDEIRERTLPDLRNTRDNTAFSGDGKKGRMDLGGVLEWGEESKVFKSILAHPKLVAKFHALVGKGYRMDHMPFVIAQDKDSEGFSLHGGTIDCSSGSYNPFIAYTCNNGHIHNSLLACSIQLSDHNAGDGGFCVVPGSHKANFKMPQGMIDGEMYKEFIQQPVTKAGDVVLFSEGTVHGAMAWKGSHQRRVCLYRFAPATSCYGRSYFASEQRTWPSAMYDDLDDAQLSVLEPPYANRLDRPNIEDDGSVVITTRNENKKQFDRAVFGTKVSLSKEHVHIIVYI